MNQQIQNQTDTQTTEPGGGVDRFSVDDVRRLPKAVLHDHLDGGLRPQTVIDLAAECGYTQLPSQDAEELGIWFRDAADSGSLVRYLETFAHTVAVMGTTQALHRVAVEAVLDHAADGAVYVELRYAPELCSDAGLSLTEVVDAVNAGVADGMDQAKAAGHDITAKVLLCAMRQAGRSREVAELTARYVGNSPVVGFDIAGPELGFPPAQHADAFAYLREHEVPITVHAGEADGLESIRGALEVGARRLGHGVRIVDDITLGGRPAVEVAAEVGGWPEDLSDVRLGDLAQRVRDEQVPLELCPASNVQTGASPSIAQHPITLLLRLGFNVCLSTDNRLMSHTSMTAEMAALISEAGWTRADCEKVTANALAAGFATAR